MDAEEPDLPSPRFDDEGKLLPYTEDEVDRLVPLLAEHYAPRRFALCEVCRDEAGQARDIRVIAWGMRVGGGDSGSDDDAGDERVVVSGYPDDDGRTISGSFTSADTARWVLAGGTDLRVGWADPG